MIGAVATAAADGRDGQVFDSPETFQDFAAGMMPEQAETPADVLEQERRNKTGVWKYQRKVYEFYHDDYIQIFVAILIFVNFIMECVQRQIDPTTVEYKGLWLVLEHFFTIAFSIELLVNFYGSWRKTFLSSAWNYFDVFVVAVGILLLIVRDLPGPLNFVKMLRAFRVFRLFGRIKSLKMILVSIEKAIPGVVNAFIIMLLVVCIYAVLATDLYAKYYQMALPDDAPVAMTARDQRYGHEYYGNFAKSLYTLFQILTGESWSELGVRPVLHGSPDLTENILSTIFFTSFVLITGIILLNVVVAVLLDGMAAASEERKQSEETNKGGNGESTENGNASDKKKEDDLKQEVTNVKAQVVEMRLKLKEALALTRRRDTTI